jgi:hypothetical protein
MKHHAIRAAITIVAVVLAATSGLARAGSGAIAYSNSDNIVGKSYGSATQIDAERWALLECREQGGKDCAIVVYENGACAALATGKGNAAGVAWNPTDMRPPGEKARFMATKSCQEKTTECKIRAWVCH